MIIGRAMKLSFYTLAFLFSLSVISLLIASKVEAEGWGWVTPISEGGYFGCGSNSRIYAKTISYTTTNSTVNAGNITVRIRNISNGALVTTLTGSVATNAYNCFNLFTQYFEITVAGGNGWKGLYMYATDVDAGHANDVISLRIYVVPTSRAHSIDAYSPTGGWFKTNNVTLRANVTTISPTYGATCSRAILWYWDGGFRNEGATACGTGNFSKTFSFAEGSHTWTAQSRDNACLPGCFGKLSGLASDGNNLGWQTFYVDVTDPSVSATHSPLNPFSTQDVTITASTTDNYSGLASIAIFVDGIQRGTTCTYGGFFGPGSTPCSRNVGRYAVGSHTYFARACDKAGNCRDSGPRTFIVRAGADLRVEPLGDYGNRHVGENFPVTFLVRNLGDQNAGSFRVEICRDGDRITYTCNAPGWQLLEIVPSLAGRTARTETFTVTVPVSATYPRTVFLLARADWPPLGNVVEQDESVNNRNWGQYTNIGPFPWFQTTGGDVGSCGRINPRIAPPPTVPPSFSADYLVIQNHLSPISNFTSARGWQVWDYKPLNVRPLDCSVAGSMYDALFEQYNVDTSNTINNLNSIPVTGGNRVFVFAGSPTLAIPAGGENFNKDPAIVFVPGHMNINGNVVVGANTGIIFVVKNYVDINPTVSQADGVYIVDGDYTVQSNGNPANERQLVVHGAVIGGFQEGLGTGEFDLGRDFRSIANRTIPTEIFNFEPKYLWLFRDIVGDKKTIWKEVAP